MSGSSALKSPTQQKGRISANRLHLMVLAKVWVGRQRQDPEYLAKFSSRDKTTVTLESYGCTGSEDSLEEKQAKTSAQRGGRGSAAFLAVSQEVCLKWKRCLNIVHITQVTREAAESPWHMQFLRKGSWQPASSLRLAVSPVHGTEAQRKRIWTLNVITSRYLQNNRPFQEKGNSKPGRTWAWIPNKILPDEEE